MRFIQLMEFEATREQAETEIEGYIAAAGSETTVRRVTLCEDRDEPGTLVQIVEFDSYEDATVNNELEVTEERSAEVQQDTGGVGFRNLDAFRTYELSE